jgi:transposase-like protein
MRMSDNWYTDEFKIEAVKQVTERGHSVADVGSDSASARTVFTP